MDNPANINPTGSNMLSACQARIQLDSGEITSEKLVRDCLDRIKTRDIDIDAWVYLDPELALEQANLEAISSYDREHVSTYIRNSEKFSKSSIKSNV